MSDKILYQFNSRKRNDVHGADLSFLDQNIACEARSFHRKFSHYQPTPLRELLHLSRKLGLASISIKDESQRFGLNAFKGLGGSFAIGKYLAKKLNRDINTLSFSDLSSAEIKSQIGDITFVTATDGNHGRGVAWAAEQLGINAVVYMPEGSSKIRAQNIRGHGAQCTITDLNYDDTVRLANEMAEKNNWILLQDTAWEGYEEIPTWIMQGYLTLAQETVEQLKQLPTHIILQAGVGSFAGAIMGYFAALMRDNMPTMIVVEPNKANCLYQSAIANDGKPHSVSGAMNTIMAGLACGEPNTVSWPILRDYSDIFISAMDCLAANGMRIAAAPRPDTDIPFISGESGAIGIGLLYEIMQNPQYQYLCHQLNLNQNSRVLLISTEGDTSPDIYEEIVWLGRSE
ncbi:TPA: diaminopropionate ammonia-lyase [Citrobacter farmeri]